MLTDRQYPSLGRGSCRTSFWRRGQATVSSPDATIIPVIRTVLSKSLVKFFLSTVFYSAVEEPVNKCVPEPQSVDAVATKMIDSQALTIPVPLFVNHKLEKSSLDIAEMTERLNRLIEGVEEKNIKIEDAIPTRGMDSAQSPGPLRTYAMTRKPV